MGHSQAGKAENRERILAEAARQVREGGLDSVSVGGLMKRVGLTHGGFYGHFESRSALLAEALRQALEESAAKVRTGGRPPSLATLARGYLSRTHRDARDTGCAMAALLSDVGRADVAARQVMEDHVEAFIATAAEALGGDEAKAIVAVSAMIGCLALSRVLTDRDRSDAVLRAVRDHVAALEKP